MIEYIQLSIHQIRWRPIIGDASVMGWVTVGAYFLTALSSFYAHRNVIKDREQYFWLFITIIMIVLGINKQLDFQSLMTDIGRVIAKNMDWYTHRRFIQFLFVVAIFAITLVVAGTIVFKVSGEIREYLLPLSGLILLMGFIVIRAMSFHHVDILIRYTIINIRMNWLFELGGIGMILFPSLWFCGTCKKKIVL